MRRAANLGTPSLRSEQGRHRRRMARWPRAHRTAGASPIVRAIRRTTTRAWRPGCFGRSGRVLARHSRSCGHIRLGRFGSEGPRLKPTIGGVASAPKPNQLDLARIRRWVEARVPLAHQDDVRLEVGVHGANVTIFELRPPWSLEVGPDWSRRPVAQLRHTGGGFWLLLWQQHSGRWERYPLAPVPTRDLDSLLTELNEDGICVFWG